MQFSQFRNPSRMWFSLAVILAASFMTLTTSPASASVCYIKLPYGCAQFPDPSRAPNLWFVDSWNGADKNQRMCMQRAADYQWWCQTSDAYAYFQADDGKSSWVRNWHGHAKAFGLAEGHSLPLHNLYSHPNGAFVFQGDGNFVLYNNGQPLWASTWAENNWLQGSPRGMDCQGRCSAQMQEDGNLVLYSPSGAFWSSATAVNQVTTTRIQPTEPHFSILDQYASTLWSSKLPSVPKGDFDSSSRRWAVNNPKWIEPTACNTTSWDQIPGLNDYFVGRVENSAPDHHLNACEPVVPGRSPDFTIVLGRMNFNEGSRRMSHVRKLLRLPADIHSYRDGRAYTIFNAYDPVAVHDGAEYWVAFECSVRGLDGAHTCMAPINFAGGEMDLSRAYMAVRGNSMDPANPYIHAAAVPKLLRDDDGRMYLYWSRVRHLKGMSVDNWESVTTQGIELVRNERGHWVPKGYGYEMPSDHWLATEVFGLEDLPGQRRTADSYQIKKFHGAYFLIGSSGDCLNPTKDQAGCYRMTIRRAGQPLGHRIFNSWRLPDHLLPSNTVQYTRFIERPGDGMVQIMGSFGWSFVPDNVTHAGFFLWDLNSKSNFFRPWLPFEKDPLSWNITAMYRTILKRDPDPGGQWNNQWSAYSGVSRYQLIRNLVYSPEAAAIYGVQSLDSRTFVYMAFRRLLGHDPDPASLDYWSSTFNSQARPRQELLMQLIFSAEFRARFPEVVPVLN